MRIRSTPRLSAREAAEAEARRATAALLERVTLRHRRLRRSERWRQRGLDLLVAMATYAGVTVAVVIGVVYGAERLLLLL